jgi:molybdenum cofactor biosynthesis enzyme MoaA
MVPQQMNDIANNDWFTTPKGDPRGYIQPHTLSELWFHTGTACNLECPFCLEGSKPGDNRLQRIAFKEAKPLIDEARELGVRQFSFTGGEPFLIKDIVRILDYALQFAPCLVLSNGVGALPKRIAQLTPLRRHPHALSIRISIDYADAERHDAGRGAGNFAASWATAARVHAAGFRVSIARQMQPGEDRASIDTAYRELCVAAGLPIDTNLVFFPDFGVPGQGRDVPYVTESCMKTYQTEATRREFMCAYSKMVVKQAGQMRVYACTLVDDDPDYDQGGSLRASLAKRVMLRHHRCFSCFKYGTSCSESQGH